MTMQQQAGRKANVIHRMFKARTLGIHEAIRKLHEVDDYLGLSRTQLHKLVDLEYEARHNAHMYDEDGFLQGEHKNLKPYTELFAFNKKTGQYTTGVISDDRVTLRIDVHDDLENWSAMEDGLPTTRPITYT